MRISIATSIYSYSLIRFYTIILYGFSYEKLFQYSKVGNIPHGLRHQNTTITVRGIDSVIDVSKYASVQIIHRWLIEFCWNVISIGIWFLEKIRV